MDGADCDVAQPERSGTSQQRRTARKALDRTVVEVVVGDQRHLGLDSGKGTQEPVALPRVAKGVYQDSDTLGRSPNKGAVSVVGQCQAPVTQPEVCPLKPCAHEACSLKRAISCGLASRQLGVHEA